MEEDKKQAIKEIIGFIFLVLGLWAWFVIALAY